MWLKIFILFVPGHMLARPMEISTLVLQVSQQGEKHLFFYMNRDPEPDLMLGES